MVRALHRAGIEVILDVVYNHTAEGDRAGPDARASAASTTASTTVSRRTTRATTSTTPAAATRSTCASRACSQLVVDSLRYWVEEMHVDGFRFDLASALAREPHDFDPHAAFFGAFARTPCSAR